MKKNISTKIYVFLFIVLIGVIGLISAGKLINFYVNDEIDYNEWSADLGDRIETQIANTFFEKFQFINFNGAMRNFLGQREMNSVIKLKNGYLLTTFQRMNDGTLQNYADNIQTLNEYLKNRGTDLVFCVTPYTSGKYNPELPSGIVDFGNDNMDRLLEKLNAGGIDTIDYREEMYKDGIDHYLMMYKTDHHWTTAAGLYAYGKLEEFIESNQGCAVDDKIGDSSQYSISKYKKWHLGSRGQRTGIYFAGIDDFDLYVPNFDTELQNIEGETGSFMELVINTDPLKNKNYASRYTYDFVFGKTFSQFKNLKCKNDVKILFVGDSFGKAVLPYLIMGFSEVRVLYNADTDKVTADYIEDYDPDVVILLYYPENAMLPSSYKFHVKN